MEIKTFLNENRQQMLEVLSKLVSYPTIEVKDDPNYPFGQANADCLNYALKTVGEMGMATKNLDNYVGFGEIGSGEKTIGVVGHLDVVPVGNGWNSDPFATIIIDDKIYGRGTSDNKGPMVAAMFAFKYLIESKRPLNKKLRLVFGCNEESGFQCIKHYVKCEGDFDLGFTPDGPFPCCFGEKGIIHFNWLSENKVFKKLIGGVATNSVPDSCELIIAADLVDQKILVEYLESSSLVEYSISIAYNELYLITKGKAAHASTPEMGINAVAIALCALVTAGVKDQALVEFVEQVNTNLHGEGCDIALKDEYGELTFNVGMAYLMDGKMALGIDIRCPFTIDNQVVLDKLTKVMQSWNLKLTSNSVGLYQPIDSPFVQLLTKTYQEVTNDMRPPISMGGGTYARGIKNTLAFGPDDGSDTHMHNANEFMSINLLLKATEIYIIALTKMLAL